MLSISLSVDLTLRTYLGFEGPSLATTIILNIIVYVLGLLRATTKVIEKYVGVS